MGAAAPGLAWMSPFCMVHDACHACMPPGKGTVVYKNNDKYEGDWANDLRHGLGTLWIYKGGKYIVRYNGEWRDDQPTVSAWLTTSGHQCLFWWKYR